MMSIETKHIAILILIILLAIFTRFVNIGSHSIYIDETWVVPTTNFHFGEESIYPKLFTYPEYAGLPDKLKVIVKKVYDFHPLFQVAAIRAASDVHPPFFFFLNYYWSTYFGYDLNVVRTPAAIYFVLTLMLLYHCLRRQRVDVADRLKILLMLTFIPLYLFFSNFARPYTLLLLLCLLSFYLSYLVIESDFKSYRIVYAVSAILCMYTHYFGGLAVAAQGIYMLYESIRNKMFKSSVKGIMLLYFSIGVIFLPWFFVMILQMKTKFPRLESNAAFVFFDFNALKELILFFSPGYSKGSTYSPINWFVSIVQIMLFLSGIWHLAARWREGFSRFWIFSFFVPFLLIIIFNILTPVFTVRNCSIILIPYIVICGFGLKQFKMPVLRNAIFAVFVLIGAYFTLYGVSVSDANAGRTIESWKKVAEYINTLPDEYRIYVHHSSYRDGLYYYINDLDKIRGLSEEQTRTGPEEKQFILVVVNYRLEQINDKVAREVHFLNDSDLFELKPLAEIASTHIYEVRRN